jgi:hypothetical protein
MITLILFYTFLIVATFFIIWLAKSIYKNSNDFGVPLSIFFIFYFTLAGAFIFSVDAYSGFQGRDWGLRYYPIFDRLFKVEFNSIYFLSCFYYSVFIFVFLLSYLWMVKRVNKSLPTTSTEIKPVAFTYELNPIIILLFSLLLVFISIYCMRYEIYNALLEGKSIYVATRLNHNKYYTIHQLANEFSVLIPFIAFAIYSSRTTRFIISIKKMKGTGVILYSACIIACLYITLIGNRRELLSGMIILSLMLIKFRKTFSLKNYFAALMVVSILFLLNDVVRGTVFAASLHNNLIKNEKKIDAGSDSFYSKNLSKTQKGVKMINSVLLSNELFYAQFSMYGVLKYNIPISYGSSLKYIAYSAVPRVFAPNRPPDIYDYYAKQVNAVPGQFYTMHHATAWYLNFGIIGLILGALILSLFCFGGYYLYIKQENYNNKFVRILSNFAVMLISAQLVSFITAGPEAYKGMILEGIMIPVLVLTLLSRKKTLIQE